MSTFAIVQSSNDLSRLSHDLPMLGRRGSRLEGQQRETLLGVWVEQHRPAFLTPNLRTLQLLLDKESPRLVFSWERGGMWALCETASPVVTRDAVVKALSAVTESADATNGGRFLPVFGPDVRPEDIERACRRLSRRHRGLILPPVRQSTEGVLLFGDIQWGSRPQLDPLDVPYLA